MSTIRLIFERQGLHLVLLVALAALVRYLASETNAWGGESGAISTETWFWLALASAVVHQGWVWLCWRLELHTGRLTRTFGESGFRLYAAGFALLSLGRFVFLIGLANVTSQTLRVDPTYLDALATVLLVPVCYLFYSVFRYFTVRRALGADHFFAEFRTMALERRGIFRFTRNGMYTYGFLVVWIPGLYAASKAALLAALFHHAYIWVHYLCTELPDMRRIYGSSSLSQSAPERR